MAGRDCKDGPGKHPDHRTGGVYSATSDLGVIRAWWDEYPNSNIGLALGGESGFVIDVDRPRGDSDLDGLAVWKNLLRIHGELPETPVAETGSLGLHIRLMDRPGHETGCSKNDLPGLLGTKKFDIKGTGGYVVVAPSIHPNGRCYGSFSEVEVAMAPEWLYQAPKGSLQSISTHASQTVARRGGSGEAEHCLDNLKGDVDPKATLSEATKSLIKEGIDDPDQSPVIFSICLGAASSRYDPHKLYEMLLDPKNKGGEGIRKKIRSPGHKGGEERFARAWNKAQFELDRCLPAINLLRGGGGRPVEADLLHRPQGPEADRPGEEPEESDARSARHWCRAPDDRSETREGESSARDDGSLQGHDP